MINKLILTGICIIGWGIGFTQPRDAIDSLQRRLQNAKDDTGRINAQVGLCLVYRLGNADSSLMYGQAALESAKRISYLPGQINALGFMCIVTEQQGNLAKSLELGFKALQLAEEHHLESLAGGALDGIAEVYIVLKDYRKSMNYLSRYILLQEDRSKDEGLAYAYFDMGVAYLGLDQLDSANFYEEKAIKHFRQYNHQEPLVYQILGDIKMKEGKPKAALNDYQMSLQIALQNNERRASAYAYNKIAWYYKSLNQSDSAFYYAGKGLEESKLIGQKKSALEAAALLSELWEEKDPKVAFRYLKTADAYKDSLFGAGNLQAIQVLVAQEEEHQKEIQDAKVNYQNQLKQYALLGGMGVFVLVALILYRNNRQKQIANKVLENTLSDLKSTQAQLVQSEKMASLGELTAGIAHEIQNPLNFVNNFSEVNNELIEELNAERLKPKAERDEKSENEILEDIKQNLEKINHHGKRADAIVKGMLQHSRTSTGQKEPTDINALADEYLRLAYHGLRAKDKTFNTSIKTDFDNSIGPVNIVPQDIGRVLLNIYNNAFYVVTEKKKQLGESFEPTVWVGTKKINNSLEISVKDNGNGIPQKVLDKIFQPFFTTKPAGQGTGLGLSLSYDIIKSHGGELKVETKEEEYTIFIIHLPA